MAGHSHWANIKHKKAKTDARRGKVWSKCARAIIVAAKNGGGDPDANLALRYAIDEARFANMPRDTIENAIKKGTGELGGEAYEAGMYEGYGPAGVAILIEILTNNRNRTAGDVRLIMDRQGGKLGTSGSVSYLFANKGEILLAKDAIGEDALMELALEAGAEDVIDQDDSWQVLTSPNAFNAVRAAIEKAGLALQTAHLTMIPSTTVTLAGEEAQRVITLIETLEDNDDVQRVHANLDVEEE